MRENAVDFINYYIAKKPDDELYIDLLTNYKGDLWGVEYEYEDEDKDIEKILILLKFRRVK